MGNWYIHSKMDGLDKSITNILDWNVDELSSHLEDFDLEIPDPNYEEIEENSLIALIKFTHDCIEQKTLSLSLIQSKGEKEILGLDLVEKLEKSISRSKNEIEKMRSELNRRTQIPSPGQEKFVFPRIAPEFSEKVDLNLLSQLLGGNFGENKEEFRDKYLTFVQFSHTHKITASQIEEIFRLFLKSDMMIFFMELDPGTHILEKLRQLLIVYYQGPSLNDRIWQLTTFERKSQEPIAAAILRLSRLLDQTETLVPISHRQSRKELMLSSAICQLALPGAKHRVEKFKRDSLMSKKFPSNALILKKCEEYEMMCPNADCGPIPLILHDPYIKGEPKKPANKQEDNGNDRRTQSKTKDSESPHQILAQEMRSELNDIKRILHDMRPRQSQFNYPKMDTRGDDSANKYGARPKQYNYNPGEKRYPRWYQGDTTTRRYNPKPGNENPSPQFNQRSQYYTGKDRETPLHFPKEPTQTEHQGSLPLQTQATGFAMGRSKEVVKPPQDIKKVQIAELPQYANPPH